MNVLAVDPGGETGLAWWRAGQHRAWHEPLEQAMDTVYMEIICVWNREMFPGRERFDLVVSEGIVITAQTLKKSRDVQDAIEFIGIMRYACRKWGPPFETQTPSDAMTFSTDAKLRALGWWVSGPDHANAASRHLLLALVRHREIDLKDLAARLGC